MSPSKPAQPKDAQDRSGEKDPVASDSEKQKQPVNAATSGAPAQPGSKVPDAQERRRKRRLLIIQTWIAKFFTWILLLGFVLLPSTYTKVQVAHQQNAPPNTGDGSDDSNEIPDIPWFAIGYTCCFINGVAICWLWRLRRDDPKWLFANLFFAGLVNAFSGLISTFVNCFSAQGGAWGSSTESTVILASVVTFIYAVLTVVYYRKSLQARRRRSGKPGVSSAMV